MAEQMKSIQVTVVDLLTFLIPGGVWLYLIVTACTSYPLCDTLPPVLAWNHLSEFVSRGAQWFSGLTLILAALLVGYVLKPGGTVVTTYLIYPFVWVFPKYRKWESLKFPFDKDFENDAGVLSLQDKLTTLGVVQKPTQQNQNPTQQELHLFGPCRRYLWLNAPVLSGLADRREGEVRMFGHLFLGALFSTMLAVWSTVGWVVIGNYQLLQPVAWLVASLLVAFLLAHGFIRLRKAEVKGVYQSTLMAMACKK